MSASKKMKTPSLKSPFRMQQLTKKTKKKARLELNEKEELSSGCLNTLREMIRDEADLCCPMNDDFLIRFLRARKFNIGRAFALLKQYYKMRKNHAEVFLDLYPEALIPVFNQGLQSVLSKRDKEGRTIFLFRTDVWDTTKCNLNDIFRANYMFLEEMTWSIETQVNGVVAIVDFKGLNFSHVTSFTPKHAQRMVNIIQDSFPARFKEFHCVNQPYIFNILFTMVKPFLHEKIRQRIHLHGSNLDSLHQFISPSVLPKSLNGLQSPDDSFIQKMLAKNDVYKDLLKYGYNTGAKQSKSE